MKYAIGLDIGGSKISGILMNEKGLVIEKYTIPTEADKSQRIVLQNIVSVIKFLKSKKKVSCIGIGIPGIIGKDKKIRLLGNIPCLNNTNLSVLLSKKISLPVVYENDANCFAYSEYVFGIGKSCSSLVGIIWGTGVGSGIVIDGKIITGSIGGAGEIGHVIIDPSSKVACANCGVYGDLESFSSAANMIKHYRRFGGKKDIDMVSLMKMKDPAAKKTVLQAIDMIGRALAFYVGIINPEIIVLGGGLSNAKVYPLLRKALLRYVPKGMDKSYSLKKHSIMHDAGALGAAALALKKFK